MDENELNQKLEAFAAKQEETNANARTVNRIESHAITHHALREGYEDDVYNHFAKRAAAGERLDDKSPREHVEAFKAQKHHLFESPAAKDSAPRGVNGSATEKLDYGLKENSAAFKKKLAGWGVRVA